MDYKERLKRYSQERKRRNRRADAEPALTDPANPLNPVYHQTNTFYPDGRYISVREPSPDCSSSSPSYDSGSSSSSSDCGGGSYGE